MFKNISLLLIPITSAFVIDISVDFYSDNKILNIDSISKFESIPINVHKDFDSIVNTLTINELYSEKIIDHVPPLIVSAPKHIESQIANNRTNRIENIIKEKTHSKFESIPINVHKDFDSIVNTLTINELYSEKIIDHEPPLIFSTPKHIESQIANNRTNRIENIIKEKTHGNSLELISSDWRNKFSQKKINFIETLLPLIAFQNQKIILERQRLIEIYNFIHLNKTLNNNDITYLEYIAKKYLIELKNKHKIDLIDELLISVNIIPNSIVLAQAANESGWGTSRFAREYNALFGQYTYDETSGVIPYERKKGEKYLIRHFSSINKSVESYFKNINTHYAYKKFRKLRSQIKKEDLYRSINILTQTLDVYAKDELYVETINSIIETNNFFQFDIENRLFINS